MKLRIGIVGLGKAWEPWHAPALRALSDRYEVLAVCDPIAHRARAIANEWNARSVDGFHALAASKSIDALLVLSAAWFGELPLFAACESEKAIYCATPLEIDADQSAALRQRASEAGIAFVAEFPNRHAPATLRLKELIATRLGAPRLLFCSQRQAANQAVGRASTMPMSRLIHSVDWCRYIVNREPTSVVGVAHGGIRQGQHDGLRDGQRDGQQDGQPLSDFLSMTLDFSDVGTPGTGTMATIRWDGFLPQKWNEAGSFRAPADLQVVCERGVAYIDLPDKLIWFDDAGQHTESLESDRPVGEQLLIYFHRAVTSLLLDTSGLEDAHRALEIIHHARQSHAERRWTPLDI